MGSASNASKSARCGAASTWVTWTSLLLGQAGVWRTLLGVIEDHQIKPFSTLPATLAFGYLESPIGPLMVAGDEASLHGISFSTGRHQLEPRKEWRRDDQLFKDAFEQLKAYFRGELTDFNLSLEFEGTAFQKTVWQALIDIPFGETVSYGALAETIGQPKASRAVGAANGANPLPIVAPCHRVIGANCSLTGFGGGLETKRFLLDHERRIAGRQGLLPF
ncbi:MAG: methylated-DNA--[protein]-cysteine S-methyltransferase [Geminicoccaceae bacterium]